MKYHFRIHNDADWMWAECIELSGCLTQAKSMEELKKNMSEVLSLYLDEEGCEDILPQLPDQSIKTSKQICEVEVDRSMLSNLLLRYVKRFY